jgi:hypothetical protein
VVFGVGEGIVLVIAAGLCGAWLRGGVRGIGVLRGRLGVGVVCLVCVWCCCVGVAVAATASVEGLSASGVTGVSAVLGGKLDPGGEDTTYHFEWGTSTAYGSSSPVRDAGAGSAAVVVQEAIGGLTGNTTYHWRLVAVNGGGEVVSPDQTFIYDTSGGGLLDGRKYELVTPPEKNDALTGLVFPGLGTYVSKDGGRVMSPSVQCFGEPGSCVGARGLSGTGYAFERAGGGWVARPLTLPTTRFETNTVTLTGVNSGIALFSAPLAGGVSDGFYRLQPNGAIEDVGPMAENSDYRILAATLATGDMSHIVYEAKESAWVFDESGSLRSLYEYVGSGNASPQLVGVSGGAGSHDLIGICGTGIFKGEEALSEDGRTVYFGVKPCGSGSLANVGVAVPAREVYARIDGSRTVKISEKVAGSCETAGCLGSPAGDAEFQGASSDGARAYFTSTQQLTDNASQDSESSDSAVTGCYATKGVGGCNLYESVCPNHCENPGERQLVDISTGDSSGGGPQVQGVVAVPTDGSHVYFVAKGVLSSEANSEGEEAEPGADNLYVYDNASPGQVTFIGQLSSGDEEEWRSGIGFANVTLDGRFLVFTSDRALTKDDTRAEGPAQVYRYDAQTGSLVRVSIGEGGYNDNGNLSEANARIVPSGIGGSSGGVGSPRTDPTMSDDGSYVFFESASALTPQALETAQNVYEYHNGHVSLISDGKDSSPNGVKLLGSSASGEDVFFTSADRLTSQDIDSQRDIYDAHICSLSVPCSTPPADAGAPCEEEECHTSAQTPAQPPLAATITLTGQGNLTPPVPSSGTVKIVSHTIHGSNLRLNLKVSEAGQIRITSPNTHTATRTASAAGSYTLTITLTTKAKAALRKKHKLHLKLHIAYTPTTATPTTLNLNLTTTQ